MKTVGFDLNQLRRNIAQLQAENKFIANMSARKGKRDQGRKNG